MAVKTAKELPAAAFYQKVDQEFYAEVKKENGGKLPADLTDANGNPRKLTLSARDRGYREKWKALAAKTKNSRAIADKCVKSACVPCAAKALAAKSFTILAASQQAGKPVKLGLTGKAHQTAVVPPKKTKQNGQPCRHETLTLECMHKDRAFKLQLPPAPGSEEIDRFEVIDDGHERVTCTTRITAGPCGEVHKGKVFDIYPDDTVENRGDSQLVFRANYQPDLKSQSFSELFPPTKSRSPQSFGIAASTCQQSVLTATVVVHPQVDWDLSVSLGWTAKASVEDKDGGPASDQTSDFEFSGSVATTVQGLRKEYGLEIKHELAQALKFADLAAKSAAWLRSISDCVGDIEVKFDYPHFNFSGTWGWREIEGSPKCGYGYNWKIGASPLLGAEVRTDILSWLIKFGSPIGPIVERIRKSLETEAKIAVEFAVEGKVNLTFDASKDAGEPAECNGDFGGELEFTLEGIIKTKEYHFWCIHAGGEVKLGGHATFSADVKGSADEKGPYYHGEVEFEGLKIYAIVEGGISFTNDDPPQEDKDYGSPDKGDAGTIHDSDEWTVIPEKTLLETREKCYFLGEEDGD